MSEKRYLQYSFGLACAWFVTVASISLSITYLSSISPYQSKPTDRRLFGKSEEIEVYKIGGCAACPSTESRLRHHLPDRSQYQNAEIDIDRWIPPIDELYDRLGIITAISDNHYEEALPWIASIQEHMPEKTIIVYDLGLNKTSLQKVQTLCNVQVRQFPFSSFPKHVKNLHTYAFKPIIIDGPVLSGLSGAPIDQITLREFGAIFWGDSSIRLKASLRNLIPISLKHHGYMTHFHAFDPKKKEEIKHQYYFTHPKLYSNLGVSRQEYYDSDDMAPHAAANRQLYLNSSYIHKNIVQPMLQCALQYRCISPKGARLPGHRFDASLLAVLIYKNLKGEWTRTNNDNRAFDEVVYLRKNTVGKEKVQTCP